MYTTRGYRQHSKENRKKSEYGQIIQRRPTFQIDNNPVVLDAYKQFILSTMPRLLRTQLETDTHNITLSDYSLSWSSSDRLPAIMESLLIFAGLIFDQYTQLNRYPISLELYSPNLADNRNWIQSPSSSAFEAFFHRISIDTNGNIFWYQDNGGQHEYVLHGSYDPFDVPDLRLGYSTSSTAVYSNPSTMKISVNYFTFYNGN